MGEIETALENLVEARHQLVEYARKHPGEKMPDEQLAKVDAAEKHLYENAEKWLWRLLGEIEQLKAKDEFGDQTISIIRYTKIRLAQFDTIKPDVDAGHCRAYLEIPGMPRLEVRRVFKTIGGFGVNHDPVRSALSGVFDNPYAPTFVLTGAEELVVEWL
jgi:hypothetical protein